MALKCWACGGKPDLGFMFGDDSQEVPICFSCIGPTIKREVEERKSELKAEGRSGAFSAIWYVYLHHDENYPMEQHPFVEGHPWTPDWMK